MIVNFRLRILIWFLMQRYSMMVFLVLRKAKLVCSDEIYVFSWNLPTFFEIAFIQPDPELPLKLLSFLLLAISWTLFCLLLCLSCSRIHQISWGICCPNTLSQASLSSPESFPAFAVFLPIAFQLPPLVQNHLWRSWILCFRIMFQSLWSSLLTVRLRIWDARGWSKPLDPVHDLIPIHNHQQLEHW